MNSVSPLLWKDVERSVGLDADGPTIFKCILDKVQVISAATVRNMVDQIKLMNLLKEPAQNVQVFCSKLKDAARKIERTGQAPSDLGSIIASRFIDCEVFSFKILASELHHKLDVDPNSLSIENVLEQLESKYLHLLTQGLWPPATGKKSAKSELVALKAEVKELQKLKLQADKKGG